MSFWLAYICAMLLALIIFPWIGFSVLSVVVYVIACLPLGYEMYRAGRR